MNYLNFKTISQLVKITALVLTSSIVFAQNSGVNTKAPNTSSILDLSKNTNKALLLPRIKLLSTTDVTTIPNPAVSLLVYATEDQGVAPNNIEKDNIYKFDGTTWNRLTVKDKLMAMDFPKVEAVGSNPNKIYALSGNFNLDPSTISNPLKLATNGAFTASKTGFYSFQIQIIMAFNGAPSQNFNLAPYLYGENLTMFSFRFRNNATAVEETYVCATGTIFLTAGQVTNGFFWSAGSTSLDNPNRYVYNQNVVWQYLGNPAELAP